jgi:hypothetical protein
VYGPPQLKSLGINGGEYLFQLNWETGGRYLIEASQDLQNWAHFASVTNTASGAVLTDTSLATNSRAFFRARHGP